MTVSSNSPSKNKNKKKAKPAKKRPRSDDDNGGEAQRKRTKTPVLRVQHGRIYDPQNGKTCHQCRQKTMDFSASCKMLKGKGNKPCTVHMCHKCLLNRYGEVAEEVVQADWSCPKCRGICNCSFCMKKNGHKPTGMLARAAKAIGLGSASELIQVKGAENLDNYKAPKKLVSSKKLVASNTYSKVGSPGKIGIDGYSDTSRGETWSSTESTPNSNHKKNKKVNVDPKRRHEVVKKGKGGKLTGKKKSKRNALDKISPSRINSYNEITSNNERSSQDVVEEEHVDNDSPRFNNANPKMCSTNLEQTEIRVDHSMSKVDILRTALGVDLSSEDIGNALQFLEFCASFGKACKVSKVLISSDEEMDNAAISPAKQVIMQFSENSTPPPASTC